VLTVNVHQAKSQLSRLLQRVEAGEEVIIARAGVPIARLVPLEKVQPERSFGRDRGRLTVPDDFNDPLPDSILASG
jgi:prevent-host-death family protein